MKLLGKAISGTCGARTYSVGGAGVTARQKVCPVNKNSLAQARRRGLFAAAASAFKALSALQREELHARAVAASATDIFGKHITLSDYAFFLREWMNGRRNEPPSTLSEPETWELMTRKSTGVWVYKYQRVYFLFELDEAFFRVPAPVFDVRAWISTTQQPAGINKSQVFGFTLIEVGGALMVGLVSKIIAPNNSYIYGLVQRTDSTDSQTIEQRRFFE